MVRTRGFEKSFGVDNTVFGISGNLKVIITLIIRKIPTLGTII